MLTRWQLRRCSRRRERRKNKILDCFGRCGKIELKEMSNITSRASIKILVTLSLFVFCVSVFGQANCLTEAEAQKVIDSINTPQKTSLNKPLQRELLNMQEDRQKLDQKIIDNFSKNQNLIPSAYEMGEKQLRRVCEIVKKNGWLSKELVGEEGASAALFLIKNNKAVGLQREIFPVVAAAAKKGFVSSSQVASLVDLIRVNSRQPQLFGTQAYVKDDFFYLYPLQNEAKVDEWRKLYDLPSLDVFIKSLQSQYQMPVLKSQRLTVSAESNENKQIAASDSAAIEGNPLAGFDNGDEVVKVESNLVNLNVRVYAQDSTPIDLNLQKNDFEVYENGKKQEVEFFSDTEAPFDLVLLLDLSGSTAGKQNLIRKTTRRFIEAARPTDRIAIVTFTSEAKIVSGLTANRQQLLGSVEKIDDDGGSGVWGAVEFVLEKIIKPESRRRRSAVVLMTDGVDSSLMSTSSLPPDYPTFIDLLETVRHSEAAIIPIYLDTESDSSDGEKQAYRSARRTMQILAEESGNQVYHAKKISDLDGVYEKIINDLSRVYSLGYQPIDDFGDGSWRALTIKIPNYPNLTARAKSGYYAK